MIEPIGKAEKFCPNAKIIHVDIDKAEISKIKRPDIAIHADAGKYWNCYCL